MFWTYRSDVPLVIVTSCCRAGGHRERISLVLQPRKPGCNYINSNDIALTSGKIKKKKLKSEESVWYNKQP